MMPALPPISPFATTTVGDGGGDPACLVEALRLLALGYWPVAIWAPDSGHKSAGKAPIGDAWGVNRPTEESLRAMWARHPRASVGLKLGPRGGLIDVDVDDPIVGEESLTALLGGECVETFGWSSARGSHHLFAWDDRLFACTKNIYKLKEFPGIEIRLNVKDGQLQTVCPPSIMTTDDAEGRVISLSPRTWNGFEVAIKPPVSLLRALEAAQPKPQPEPPRAEPFSSRATSGNRPDAEARARMYLDACQPAIAGQSGHNQTFKIACKVGPGFNLPQDVAIRLIRDHYNHRCQPQWSEKEILHKVADAYKEEANPGRLLNEDRHQGKAQGTAAGSGDGKASGGPAPEAEAEQPERELALRSFADLEAVPIEWIAPGRIPLGKLVLLAGPGGLGKSTLTLDWAARLTRGLPLFDEPCDDEPDIQGAASVLLVASEDDAADTQLPRFLAAGGDPSRIFQIVGVRGTDGKVQPFSVADLEPIHQTLTKRPDVRLVIIDPIAAYIGRAKVDDHKNSELSAIFQPLADLAAMHKVTILMIAHFNKSTSATAVNRVMGGAAYGNSVRAVFVVVADPDNEGLRIVGAPKFNLGPEPPSIAYRIRSLEQDYLERVLEHRAFARLNPKQQQKMSRQLARIEWQGETATSADDALAGGTPKSRMGPKPQPSKTDSDRIREWALTVVREAGGSIPSKTIEAMAEANGISYASLHRAVPKGDDDMKRTNFGFQGVWHWVLKYNPPPPEREVIPEAEEGGPPF